MTFLTANPQEELEKELDVVDRKDMQEPEKRNRFVDVRNFQVYSQSYCFCSDVLVAVVVACTCHSFCSHHMCLDLYFQVILPSITYALVSGCCTNKNKFSAL